MAEDKAPTALEPLPPPRMSRIGPTSLAPLQQRRSTLEPLSSQPLLPTLAKPPLPSTTPVKPTAASTPPPPDPAAPQQPPLVPPAPSSDAPDASASSQPSPPPAPPSLSAAATAPSALANPLPSDTREPASIDGLSSPAATAAAAAAPMAAGGSVAAAAAAAAAAPSRHPTRRPSLPDAPTSATTPDAGPAQPQGVPQPQQPQPPPPPLPLRDSAPVLSPAPDAQTPTLPGAVPTTPTAGKVDSGGGAAAAGVVGADGADTRAARAAAGGGGAKRVPPKEPPPPAAVDHASVTTDGRTVEQYIPFGFVELRGKLLADFPRVFGDPGVVRKFTELCKWMSLRNSLRLALDYGDADEKYAALDPDKDTLAFKAAAVAEETAAAGGPSAAAGAPSPQVAKSLVPKTDLKSMVEDLYGELNRILEKAEFAEMPPDVLEKAKKHKSLMGVEVIPASEEYLEYRLHYRGTRTKKIQFRRWGLFKRQIEMSVYERLAISFRLKKPVRADDLPSDLSAGGTHALGVDTRPWYQKLMCGRRASGSPALRELRDEYVYLKLFKDVLQSDVDMLLPGAVIKFTWLDYMMIWVPIVVGCGMAVWKAINGTIDFSNLINAALSIVLIVMPITWGVRAYFAIKEKERLHQAHLNALFLLHNLNNNAGVISQLLGEAQEQEDNETMLAYFFLWQGEATPKPVPKIELDRAVEAYLQSKLDELNVAVRMDYEVIDSMTKLERLGLVHISRGPDGVRRLQALPLDLALEKAHVRHFDESREAGQPELPPSEARRQVTQGLTWHECADVFRPTGQKFRYFWNSETGESQYHEPDEPYIKLGAAAALDLEDAYGINMSDPKKHPEPQQPAPLHHAKTA